MNLIKIFLVIICISITLKVVSQDGKTYARSKVYLNSGKVIKVKNLTFKEDLIIGYVFNSTYGFDQQIRYSYNDIKEVKALENVKRQTLPGLLIGTGVGLSSMLLVKREIEKPEEVRVKANQLGGKEEIYDIEVKSEMKTSSKLIIVASGSLLGTLIGYSIKKGWKVIYPSSSTALDKIGVEFYAFECNELNYNCLRVKYTF